MMKELLHVVGKDVITQDAFILGCVQDIRCEDLNWSIVGLKVKSSSTVSGKLNMGSGRSMIMLEPEDFCINDVLLSEFTIDTIRSRITVDNDGFLSIASIEGMKVYASDAFLVGTVYDLVIDYDSWRVISMIVKIDKNAYGTLGIKKGLFAKKASGLLMSHIEGVSDTIVLGIDSNGVKSQLSLI